MSAHFGSRVTKTLGKFCQWWRKQCHTADIESLAMSGLPVGVAGRKGGVAIRSRGEGQGAVLVQPQLGSMIIFLV